MFLLQIIFWLILAYLAYFLLIKGSNFIILDNFNLLLHEAGHFLFSEFGEFLTVLGGTIVQITLPIVFTIYFFYHARFYSGSVILFWLGQNLINISKYIKDAQAMKIELIGDRHDWHYLLGKLDLLEKDIMIGQIVFYIAAFLMIAALLVGLYALSKDYKMRKG